MAGSKSLTVSLHRRLNCLRIFYEAGILECQTWGKESRAKWWQIKKIPGSKLQEEKNTKFLPQFDSFQDMIISAKKAYLRYTLQIVSLECVLLMTQATWRLFLRLWHSMWKDHRTFKAETSNDFVFETEYWNSQCPTMEFAHMRCIKNTLICV